MSRYQLLDAKPRVWTNAQWIKLHQSTQTTVVYVTHHQDVAMTLGTRKPTIATLQGSR